MMNQPPGRGIIGDLSKEAAKKDRKTGPVCRFIAIAEIEI